MPLYFAPPRKASERSCARKGAGQRSGSARQVMGGALLLGGYVATVCGGRAVLLPAIFAAGFRHFANCAKLNRQIREVERLVTHGKQTAAIRSNRQKFQFCLFKDLDSSREFCAFLTGSGSQIEIDVTHSKQTIAPFLTGSRTACFDSPRTAIYPPKSSQPEQKKARPSQEGRAVVQGPNLLTEITSIAADSRAEIPSENCEVADVQAAGSELDVIECKRVKQIIVDFRVLGLARFAESSGCIDDSCQRGRGNAGATYDEPARAENGVTVENPNPGVRVRVEREVRSSAEAPDDVSDPVLKGRTGFHLARAATGVLPGVLEFESAGRAVAGERSASGGDHVRRCAWINGAGTIPSRGKINDAGCGEVHVKQRFLSKFPASETHGDFATAVLSYQLAGQDCGVEQIAEVKVLRFHQKNLGIRRHGVRPLDVQRGFEFRSASGVWARIHRGWCRPVREHYSDVRSGQTELRRESSQIACCGRIVKSFDQGYRASSSGWILGGYVRIAAAVERRRIFIHKLVDAGNRGWCFKEEPGKRRQLLGLSRSSELTALWNPQFNVGMSVNAGITRQRNTGLRSHDMAGVAGLICGLSQAGSRRQQKQRQETQRRGEDFSHAFILLLLKRVGMHAQAGIAELCEQTNAANELTLALNSCQGLTSSIRKPKTLPSLGGVELSARPARVPSLGVRIAARGVREWAGKSWADQEFVTC
jgi:hypothetical protein